MAVNHKVYAKLLADLSSILPSVWNVNDKCSTLALSPDGLSVHYKGVGKSHRDAAAVRADKFIPCGCGMFYFEVTIRSKGRDGYMGVGLSTKEVNLQRLPGWEKDSYGYHGDDGHAFCASSSGFEYGPTYTTGDVIGCCLNYLDSTCFYTKNGLKLGVAFNTLPLKLYPSVGLQTQGEAVDTNFGKKEFMFDIEEYFMSYVIKIRNEILAYPLKTGEEIFSDFLQRLVLNYLGHYGFSDTAKLFSVSTGQEITESFEWMQKRQAIQAFIMAGKISEAISFTRSEFPSVLSTNKKLFFQLKVQQFIEMLKGVDQPKNEEIPHLIKLCENTSLEENQKTLKFLYEECCSTEVETMETSDSAPGDQTTPLDNGTINGWASSSNGHVQDVNGYFDPYAMDIDIESDLSNKEEDLVLVGFGRMLSMMNDDVCKNKIERDSMAEKLMDIFTLIAYTNPYESPLSHLLDNSYREDLATLVNNAIIADTSSPTLPPLEVLVRYLILTTEKLRYEGCPKVGFVDFQQWLC